MVIERLIPLCKTLVARHVNKYIDRTVLGVSSADVIVHGIIETTRSTKITLEVPGNHSLFKITHISGKSELYLDEYDKKSSQVISI